MLYLYILFIIYYVLGIMFFIYIDFNKVNYIYIPNKRQFIKGSHLILEGGHPSPLNRYKDKNFFGQKFFSKTNEYLEKNGKTKINW